MSDQLGEYGPGHRDLIEPHQLELEHVQLEGLDLSKLSLDDLEITELGDVMKKPEMAGMHMSASCSSCWFWCCIKETGGGTA